MVSTFSKSETRVAVRMATDRLRRRVAGDDDLQGAKPLENFVQIGTPLPSLLDRKRDPNEFKPAWQQEVYDAQGRRRFHGAFTGGFSAGYYNTVGSKEGWTPSEFRSSRTNRHDKDARKQMGVEDFMDEEDLEDFRKTAVKDSVEDQQQQHQHQDAAAAVHDPLMGLFGAQSGAAGSIGKESSDSIVRPAKLALGYKLLNRMGWKQGQGLGPRVSAKRRRELMLLAKGHIEPGPSSQVFNGASEDTKDEEAEKHMYAPPDTSLPLFEDKKDTRGLGWVGPQSASSQANARSGAATNMADALKRAREEERGRKKAGGGFGIGALEQDSDDEDQVYAQPHRIEDSTLARKDDDRIILGPSKTTSTSRQDTRKPYFTTSKFTDDKENTWHDGRPMIPGFKIATDDSSLSNGSEMWFEPPKVPVGWTPDPQRVWSKGQKEHAQSQGTPSTKPNLAPEDRAKMLGEARNPGPPPSIANYLTKKEQERLEAGPSDTSQPSFAVQAQQLPSLDTQTAKAALLGYMPFANDAPKQGRYRAYLESQRDAVPASTLFAMLLSRGARSEQDVRNEVNEFQKSAQIFRPMSSAMASRFSSSSKASNELPRVEPGLFKPSSTSKDSTQKGTSTGKTDTANETAQQRAQEKEREALENLTAQQIHARRGDFGEGKTRVVKRFLADKLLFRRFGLPDPFAQERRMLEASTSRDGNGVAEDELFSRVESRGGGSAGKKGAKLNEKWEESRRELQRMAEQRAWESAGSSAKRDVNPDGNGAREGEGKELRVERKALENVGMGEDEEQGRDTETYVKPPLDIFKAVFADDDDDDDEDDDDDDDDDVNNKGQIDVTASIKAKAAVEGEKEESAEKEAINVIDTEGTSFRPTFVPRSKRVQDEEEIGQESLAAKKHKKEKKKDKKSKPRGMLTFSFDGDDEAGGSTEPALQSQKPSNGSEKKQRPKASDLFH